jgi:NADP-dependent 3-hydroxy acid dehydrogenase YdfG
MYSHLTRPVETESNLQKRTALVTGGSSGIGRSIAIALARAGTSVFLVGRDADRLAEATAAAARPFAPATALRADLSDDADLSLVVESVGKNAAALDVLVHGAGIIHRGSIEHASACSLDEQYAINVRVPYVLTQRLLPLLVKARGQIVFVNSSAGLTANRPEIGQYAATKHALTAIADSIRAEVNSKDVRVLSLYLGRTATAMQESLYRQDGVQYHADALLQPDDVATMVIAALDLSRTAEVTDISIRPMRKP